MKKLLKSLIIGLFLFALSSPVLAQIDSVNDRLWSAIQNGKFATAEVLLTHGADVNHTNEKGETLLIWIIRNRNSKRSYKPVKFLLANGADPNIQDLYGNTPLYYYHTNWDQKPAIAKLLLEYGADPNASNRYGFSPLHAVALIGRKNTVKTLIKYGADPNAQDLYGNTPLHYLVWDGLWRIPKEIMKIDFYVRRYPFFHSHEWFSSVHDMTGLKAGITKKIKGTNRRAILGGGFYLDITKFLLRNGADPNIQNNDAMTVIQLATVIESETFVRFLLDWTTTTSQSNDSP